MNVYRWNEDSSLNNLYNTEIAILKNGLGGDFKLLELVDTKTTGGLVYAIGVLNYEDKEIHITIQFPTKYPYTPPKIVPVIINDLNGQRVIAERRFGKGNQYGDGEMCLLQREEWNPNSHNIGWALRQAQKWLSRADSKEGFPKDEIVQEIPQHFPHHGQVLLPKEFKVEENLQKGVIQLTPFKHDHYILQRNIISDNVFKLNLPDEQFNWYKFPKNVKFSEVFPSYDIHAIIRAITTYFGENKLIIAGAHNIAFYFPGEKMKWHFFKIQVNNNSASMKYLISHVIEDEIYLRTNDIFDESILKKKRVTIIGLGAIGSEVCLSLAKNGIGNFHLFDNDTFEIGNSVRHSANILYIGEQKSQVCKQLVKKVNPNITVNPYHIDILQDNGMLEQSLENSDLCLVLTGEDPVDYMINDLYFPKYNIPFVFAGVAIGGFSGSIQILRKGDACLRCLSLHELDTLPTPKSTKQLDKLPPEYGNCSGPALPGSEIDIKEISIQVSRLSLQLLLGDESPYASKVESLYKWHGPFGSKTKAPFYWEIETVPIHKDCEFCNKN